MPEYYFTTEIAYQPFSYHPGTIFLFGRQIPEIPSGIKIRPGKFYIVPIVIKICAFVISTGGPRSGPKWRNLLKTDFSTPLRCARNDTNKRIGYPKLV
jgi:hypothetical protein